MPGQGEHLAGKLLVMVRGSSVARIPIYEALRAAGATVVVVHPSVMPGRDHCVDEWVLTDSHDCDVLEAALRAHLGDRRPDAIMSYDEYGVFPAAVVAERFGLRPTPLPSALIRTMNVKSAFRAFCEERGVGAPKSAALRSPSDDVRAATAHLSFPVVAKPTPGAGSFMVKQCQSIEELEAQVAVLWPALNGHRDARHFEALGERTHILVEEFVGGDEVDIDCAVADGRVVFAAMSDNRPSQPPYFQELGGLMPSALPDDAQGALFQLFADFVAACGPALHGVLHFEAKYDGSRRGSGVTGAFTIEANCRLGSAETRTLVLATYGVDLGVAMAELAAGVPPTGLPPLLAAEGTVGPPAPLQHCASLNAYPAREGVLACFHPPPEDDAVVFVSMQPRPGDPLELPPKFFGCAAWMVVRAESSDAAMAALRRLEKQLVICVDQCSL